MAQVVYRMRVGTYRVAADWNGRGLILESHAETAGGPVYVIGLWFGTVPPWSGKLTANREAGYYLPPGNFQDFYHIVQTEDPVYVQIWVNQPSNDVVWATLETTREPTGEGFSEEFLALYPYRIWKLAAQP